MNVRRNVLLGGLGVAIAAWFAAAYPSSPRPFEPPRLAAPNPVDVSGAALAAEIQRLHERLKPSDVPVQSRDLFRYASRGAASAGGEMKAALPVVEMSPPVVPVAPFKLAGLAEEASDHGPVQTAIIATANDVLFVKEGDVIQSRYRVVRIAPDGVECVDTVDGSPVHLLLN